MESKHYLSKRENWQASANATGTAHEKFVETTFTEYFGSAEGSGYSFEAKPTFLDQCFLEYQYTKKPDAFTFTKDTKEGHIYFDKEKKKFLKWNGKKGIKAKEGMIPDGIIRNTKNGKCILLEDKHQNDAGNAQERACRYATPKVSSFLQTKMGITGPPVCWVFSGALANKSKYQDDISFCLDEDLFVLIKPSDDKKKVLLDWFKEKIRPLLED